MDFGEPLAVGRAVGLMLFLRFFKSKKQQSSFT
jgi:hypothetical protein